MLNEKYEFDQYMTRVISNNQERAQDLTPAEFIEKYGMRLGYRRLVTKDLEGIKRPLIIIAREFLSSKHSNEDKQKTVECLKSWCGMIGKIEEKYSNDSSVIECRNLLPEYIEFVLGYEGDKKEAAQKRSKDVTNKDWAKTGFDFDFDTSDYHGIRFERIVAEALVNNEIAGNGLDRYYLVSTKCTDEKEIFRDVYWKSEPKDFVLGENGWTQGRKNRILMAVAVKKMKARTENSRWFPKVDFSNWMQDSSGNSNGFNVFKYKPSNVMITTIKSLTRKDKNDKDSKNIIVVTLKEGKDITIESGNSTLIKNLSEGDELWIRKKKDSEDYELCSRPFLFTEKNLISSQEDKELIINEEWENRCGWEVVTKDQLLEKLNQSLIKDQGKLPVFYRDYYFKEDNGIFLQQNKFYKEEEEVWRTAAKNNPKIAELYKASFGEEPC